ncbi:MAG TPA: amidohydrolase family protein [Blastocatellia bacterium]|nr:amidohydrolase family protein [Blastocatellia bacterium]
MASQMRLILSFFLIGVMCGSTAAAQMAANGDKTTGIRVSEGTTLSFDLSPDGKSIVFDLLGQLWVIPAAGGAARPITDAVRDIAEDSDPSFSPDGRRVVFSAERNGRTGLWLLNLDSVSLRQLTQLPKPDAYEGHPAWSPDGRFIAFARLWPPDSPSSPPHCAIVLLDPYSGTNRELSITGLPAPFVSDPVWVRGGKEIAFVNRVPQFERGGRVWIVPAEGGKAAPITDESIKALAPSFTPDGRRKAYFAPDSTGRMQVWMQDIVEGSPGSPIRVTNHTDVTPTRIRWSADGSELVYSADGRLWKIAALGGQPREIQFTAQLSITRSRQTLPAARFPEPGQKQPARGFRGLALSPDGRRIGMLALGKLWIIPVGGSPRAVTDVPFDAASLAWSPDGSEVAWSAGVDHQEDLFATSLATGATRRITSLPGREAYPAYSPDGRHLAFVHLQEDGALRVVDARASNVSDPAQTKSLGSIGSNWTSTPQWSPESDGLLVSGPATEGQPSTATFVSLSGGQRQDITRFPDAPIFLQWTQQHMITFVRHDRLWQAPFDKTGMLSDPKPLGTDAALYASSSRDGTLLFVSAGGLRLRSPDGKEQSIGWPVSYTPPVAEPMLIKNARIIDGTSSPISAPRDILVEQGRIKQIAPAGRISPGTARVLDAAGRAVIPGLMDLHAHVYRPDLLPGYLYFGVTTIRDQGAAMAPMVAYADAMAAGVLPGPRVGYGGFQFYSDWPFDEEQGRGIEPEADPDHIKRAVDLAEAFGAQHIKTRTFRRWDINARMIAEAHRRGMRATGHCSHPLPLVAAGMDAKEHIGMCESRGNTFMYDDLIQLFRAANIGVVPTLSYLELAVRISEKPEFLDGDSELAPFMPARDSFDWMIKLKPAQQKEWSEDARRARITAAKLSQAGLTIGTGTDVWQIPTAVHMELEQLVASGLTPMQAIVAGTSGAARILGADKDLGTIEIGKRADLVLLDADPLTDIRNTRRIWQVVQSGRVVDRAAIIKVIRPR